MTDCKFGRQPRQIKTGTKTTVNIRDELHVIDLPETEGVVRTIGLVELETWNSPTSGSNPALPYRRIVVHGYGSAGLDSILVLRSISTQLVRYG